MKIRGAATCGTVLAVLMVPVSTGCWNARVRQSRTLQQVVETQPLHTIEVESFNGSVNIEGADRTDVGLEVTLTAYGFTRDVAAKNLDKMDCEISAADGTLRFQARKATDQWMGSAAFVLSIPQACNVVVKTTNGAIRIENLVGDVRVASSNGRIECTRVTGELQATTSNGTIVAQGCFGAVDIETSNGSVTYQGVPQGKANRIQTSNGPVRVELAENRFVEIEASTSNGSIRNTLPVADAIHAGKTSWRALVGTGEPTDEIAVLTVDTSNGSIVLAPVEPGTMGSEADAVR